MGKTAKRAATAFATGGLSEAGGGKPLVDESVKQLTPDIPGLPGIPTSDDNAASDASRKDRRKRRGRSSTILTKRSPSGGLGGGSPRAGGGSQLLG